MERINELLLREISSFVTGRHDPDIGFITFTGVEVTEDLMDAKVFYSVLGNEDERLRAAQRLDQLNPEIWRSLRHLESLRRIPKLHYHFDDTPQRAARVYEIIETLRQKDDKAGAPQAQPDPTTDFRGRAASPKGNSPEKKNRETRRSSSRKTR